MTNAAPDVTFARTAILGGNSGIGQALLKCGDRKTLKSIVRQGARGDLVVSDYADVMPSWFEGCDTVVNCIGISTGSQSDLEHVNVVLAERAALAAKDAGVRHFIHISSFSVHGRVEEINATTPVAPVTDYGRSKAKCDVILSQLRSDNFRISLLRLPAIIGPKRTGKMERLIRLWRMTGVLVKPKRQAYRSVISVGLSAKAIGGLSKEGGLFYAADPERFSFELLATVIAEKSGNKVLSFRIPRTIQAFLKKLSPGAHWSFFQNAILADDCNEVIKLNLPSDLKDCLETMLRNPA